MKIVPPEIMPSTLAEWLCMPLWPLLLLFVLADEVIAHLERSERR